MRRQATGSGPWRRLQPAGRYVIFTDPCPTRLDHPGGHHYNDNRGGQQRPGGSPPARPPSTRGEPDAEANARGPGMDDQGRPVGGRPRLCGNHLLFLGRAVELGAGAHRGGHAVGPGDRGGGVPAHPERLVPAVPPDVRQPGRRRPARALQLPPDGPGADRQPLPAAAHGAGKRPGGDRRGAVRPHFPPAGLPERPGAVRPGALPAGPRQRRAAGVHAAVRDRAAPQPDAGQDVRPGAAGRAGDRRGGGAGIPP